MKERLLIPISEELKEKAKYASFKCGVSMSEMARTGLEKEIDLMLELLRDKPFEEQIKILKEKL